ncbi:MAG: adenosylcobinamide-GDP ribazoletransferase [Rhodocyclales bacterium]|nr:adenosylcobinamide-GDP ribazoletransferase [Rhodocyclales bacterium]
MKRELEYFFAALRFFTRLPVPAWVGHSSEQLNHAARYFPLVGIIIGAIGAAVTEAAALALPIGVAVLLGMAATVLATGGFHEDGFADSCDGFGGGVDQARVLAIMKDSRIGSYAAIGLGLLLLTKWNALVEIDAAFGPPLLALTLIAGHAVSRLASTVLIYFLTYVRDDDSSKSKPLAQRLSGGELLIAALCGLAPCLLLPLADLLFGLAATALAALLAARYFLRRIGGYTGDCLGATQQVAELAFYLGMLCTFS